MPTNPAALAWALVLGHEARVSGDDEREVREMAESNFHGRMMNIAVVLRQMLETTTNPYLDDVGTYKRGHRDARHAAAEIANEADARIEQLEAQLAAAQERERGLVTLIGDLEWIYDKEYCFKYCPECENVEGSGHAEGCRTAAALAAAQQEGK